MLGEIVGKGGDGTIYELINQDEPYVVKYVQPKVDGIENYLEYFILLYADHPHIMNAREIELNDHSLVKILQKRALGDLGRVKVTNKRRIMMQMVDAVSYLSSKGIIHGDIKPSNVLVMSKDVIKLNDFSLSRFTASKSPRAMYTLRYRPPEVIIGKASLKSDVYALGCTMYEFYFNTVYDRWNFKFSSQNTIFHDLIYNMTLSDPEERYSIYDVKQHPYFSGLKFPSYDPLDIDVIASLRSKWIWGDSHVFITKCMNEEIPPHSNCGAVDRVVCDSLRFKILDDF